MMRGRDARRALRISVSALPLVLASVALRRIHEKTGIPQDIHAHDHVISHVLPIGDCNGDIELSPCNNHAGIHDVSFFGSWAAAPRTPARSNPGPRPPPRPRAGAGLVR